MIINKLGFGFLRLPKKGAELDWEVINEMVDAYMAGGRNFLTPATHIWTA